MKSEKKISPITEGHQLKLWMDSIGKSVIELAKDLSLSRQNIYHNIRQEYVSDDFKNRLLLAGYDVFGTGLIKNNELPETKTQLKRNLMITSHPIALTNHEGIPMYPTNETTFDPDNLPVPVYYLTDEKLTDAEFGIELRGQSMMPMYPPGTRLALKRISIEEVIYSLVYFVITKSGLKTVMYIDPDPDGEKVVLRPENPRMHPTPIKRENITHVFVVLGAVTYT